MGISVAAATWFKKKQQQQQWNGVEKVCTLRRSYGVVQCVLGCVERLKRLDGGGNPIAWW